MKKIFFFLSLFTCFSANAFSQQLIWERSVSTNTNIGAFEYIQLEDKGFAALFYRVNNSAVVTRYDSLGFEVWSTPLSSQLRLGKVQEHCVIKAVAGGLLVGVTELSADTNRLALIKLNWQGTPLWTKIIPTGRKDNAVSDLHIRSANEYVLLAAVTNTNQPIGNGSGIKHMAIGTDSLGNSLWKETYLDPLATICYPKNIIPYKPNGYIFTGNTGYNGVGNPRFIKTDLQGNVLQNELLANIPASPDYLTSLGNFIPISDGNITFTGYNSAGGSISNRYLLASKMDTAANVLWTYTHQEPGNAFGSSKVAELANGNILLVAPHQPSGRIVLLTLSPQGVPLDTAYVTPSGILAPSGLTNIFLQPDGSLIYASYFFLAKIGNVGFPTTFTATAEQISLSNLLGNAYPNPAENTVTIPYQLPIGVAVAQLHIAEVATGQLVYHQPLHLSAEQARIELHKLKSGLYSYTLMLDGVPAITKKLVVIK